MRNTRDILIIENELLIIDSFKNALNEISNFNTKYKIKLNTSGSYEDALEKAKSSIMFNAFDLIILNMDIPILTDKKPFFAEDLGLNLRSILPNAKILVFANNKDNYRINNIIETLNPEAFIIKSDIDFKGLKTSLNTIFEESSYYCKFL